MVELPLRLAREFFIVGERDVDFRPRAIIDFCHTRGNHKRNSRTEASPRVFLTSSFQRRREGVKSSDDRPTGVDFV